MAKLRKNKKIFFLILLILLLLQPFSVSAEDCVGKGEEECTNDPNCQWVPQEQECVPDNENSEEEAGGGGEGEASTPELEVKYPGDEDEVPTSTSDLAKYFSYIYKFSFYILGFVLVGAVVYNGGIILTSGGEPGKRADAMKNLRNTILGGILVLSSYLIISVINPDIIPKPATLSDTESALQSGIYLCNYNASGNIQTKIDDYVSDDFDTRQKAVKDLLSIMDPEGEGNKKCILAQTTNKIDTSDFEMTKDNHTIFSIPTRTFNENGEVDHSFEYGVVLYEFENKKGRLVLYPNTNTGSGSTPFESNFYNPSDTSITHDGFDFTPSSMIVFRRPNISEEEKEKMEVKIYADTGQEGTSSELLAEGGASSNNFQQGIKLKEYTHEGEDGFFKNNARSIKVYPSRKLIVVLFPKDEDQDFDHSYSSLAGVDYERKGPIIINRSKQNLPEDVLPEETEDTSEGPVSKTLLESLLIIPARTTN